MTSLLDSVRRGLPVAQPFIDVHCHFGPWSNTTQVGAMDEHQVVASMDRYGCDIAWVCASGAGWADAVDEQNDRVFRFAGNFPDRILPYCTLSSLDPDGALAELERRLEGGPCIGVKLHRGRQPAYTLRDDWLQPVFERLDELGLVHMNHDLGDRRDLAWVLDRYPNMQVLSGHGIYRDIDDMAMARPNLMECTCAAQSYGEVEREVLRLERADTLVVGSDFTIFHIGFGIGMVAYARISETDKLAIIGGNAIDMIEHAGLADAVSLGRLGG